MLALIWRCLGAGYNTPVRWDARATGGGKILDTTAAAWAGGLLVVGTLRDGEGGLEASVRRMGNRTCSAQLSAAKFLGIATPRWHEKNEHLPAMPDGATFHTVHTSEMRL